MAKPRTLDQILSEKAAAKGDTSAKKDRAPRTLDQIMAEKNGTASGESFGSKAKGKALGLLGVVGDVLSGPQQALFKAGKGIRETATGDWRAGLTDLKHAGGELINPTHDNEHQSFTDAIGATKLPKGVETGAQVLLDPLNFLTFGAGTVAKSASKTLATEGAETLATKIAKTGLKSLDDAERVTVRDSLLKGAEMAKNPEKTVAKQLKHLEVRGRGGVTLRIPGTRIAATPLSADQLSRAGAKELPIIGKSTTAIRDAAKQAPGIKQARHALVSMSGVKDELGAKVADSVKSIMSNRTAQGGKRTTDLLTELDAGIRSFKELAKRDFNTLDDAFVHSALEAGEAARNAAKLERPALAGVIDAFDSLRKTMGKEQFEAKVLKNLRDPETYLHRLQAPKATEQLGRASTPMSESAGSVASSLRQGATQARHRAPNSTVDEINQAIRMVHGGEQIPQGLLRDDALVNKLQRPVLERQAALRAQGDEVMLRNLDPRTGQLTDAAKAQVAKDEGAIAVRKSIRRQMEKGSARDLGTADRRLGKLQGEAADRAERLQTQATRRLVNNDVNLAQNLDRRIKSLDEKLAQKSKQASEETETLVRDIAQKLKPGTDLYEQSAVRSILDRGVEASKALSSADMMNDMRAIANEAAGTKLVLSAEDVAAGAKLPHDYVAFDLPKLGTFHAPQSIHDEVMKFRAVVGEDASVKAFAKHMATANKWWKTMVTVHPVGGIAFGMRNARSNAWLTFADGMAPTWFKRGAEFQHNVNKLVKESAGEITRDGLDKVLKAGLGARDYKIYEAARAKGIIGEGFFDLDVAGVPKISVKGYKETVKGGKLGGALKAVAGSEGAASRAGRSFNQAVEQNARLSHFLYSIDRLGDMEQAALRTKTVLFDYSDLTAFEQRVLKKPIPFWTFMKKVVPAEFRAVAENPARALLPEKVANTLTDPIDDKGPEYLRRAGARTIKSNALTDKLHLSGMISTPERPYQAAAKTLEPLAQLGAAIVPGKQGALEPEKGFGQAARSILAPMGGVPGSQLKALAEEAGDVDLFTGYKLAEGERLQRALTEMYPPLGRLNPALLDALPDSVKKALIEKRRIDKGAQTPAVTDILSLLGIKIEPSSKSSKNRLR